MLKLFTAAALLAATAACASPAPDKLYALVPIESGGQTLAGLTPKDILESRQPGGIVSIRADDRFAHFGAGFLIAVQNKSGQPVKFGPGDIKASMNGQALPVLAAAELDEKVKGETRAFIRANSRTGSVDLDNASAEVARDYQFNNFGGHAAGTESLAFTDDQGSGYRTDRNNRELQAQTVAEAAAKLQANTTLIAQRALKAASVAPEQMSGGIVVVEPPGPGGKIDIQVTFNGKTHKFVFTATPTS